MLPIERIGALRVVGMKDIHAEGCLSDTNIAGVAYSIGNTTMRTTDHRSWALDTACRPSRAIIRQMSGPFILSHCVEVALLAQAHT